MACDTAVLHYYVWYNWIQSDHIIVGLLTPDVAAASMSEDSGRGGALSFNVLSMGCTNPPEGKVESYLHRIVTRKDMIAWKQA